MAIAEHLARRLKEEGYGTRPVTGAAQGDWVLVDAGDVIVHVFRPEVRDYYDLEGMWNVASPQRAASACARGDWFMQEVRLNATFVAVGHARGTSEGALCDEYLGRAVKIGPQYGLHRRGDRGVGGVKARNAEARMQDEAERLARRVPDGAHIMMLDAKGKGMTSRGFRRHAGRAARCGHQGPGVCDRWAGRAGAAARARRPAAAWPSGPRPGRIYWPARC